MEAAMEVVDLEKEMLVVARWEEVAMAMVVEATAMAAEAMAAGAMAKGAEVRATVAVVTGVGMGQVEMRVAEVVSAAIRQAHVVERMVVVASAMADEVVAMALAGPEREGEVARDSEMQVAPADWGGLVKVVPMAEDAVVAWWAAGRAVGVVVAPKAVVEMAMEAGLELVHQVAASVVAWVEGEMEMVA